MKSIVILGGGFGGLRAALDLDRLLKRAGLHAEYRVVLVDREEYHTFLPLLYEVATTPEAQGGVSKLHTLVRFPFPELLTRTRVSFIRATVQEIDHERRIVRHSTGELPFDRLVIALGSDPDFYNIPGLAASALTLKSFADAIAIREAVTSIATPPRDMPAHILVAGAGPTGIELAAELSLWASELGTPASPAFSVTLLDGADHILPGFPESIVRRASRRLDAFGVGRQTGVQLIAVEKNTARLSDGSIIPFNLIIWTGGVQAAPLTASLPTQRNPKGRLSVDFRLSLGIPGIYAIGDVAAAHDAAGKPTSCTAPNAIAEGRMIARVIVADLAKASAADTPDFHPRSYPYILPVGAKYAIAVVGPVVFSGLPAWVFKGLVELRYFFSILPIGTALRLWFRGLLVFISNRRLG